MDKIVLFGGSSDDSSVQSEMAGFREDFLDKIVFEVLFGGSSDDSSVQSEIAGFREDLFDITVLFGALFGGSSDDSSVQSEMAGFREDFFVPNALLLEVLLRGLSGFPLEILR